MDKKREASMVYLNYEDYEAGGEVCSGEEGEAWPNYNDINHDYSNFVLSLRSGYPSKKFDIDANVGDMFHIVVVHYNTGHSFGRENNVLHFEGIYSNLDDAEEIARLIENDKYEGYKAWEGYFEEYCYTEVISLTVEE